MKTTIDINEVTEKMVESYQVYKDGFKSLDEHLSFCSAIRTLFGDEAFAIIAKQAEEMSK